MRNNGGSNMAKQGKQPQTQTKTPPKPGYNSKRPKPQTEKQARSQERHMHRENMALIKNQKGLEQIQQEGKTARTVARAGAITSAIQQGFRSAQDTAGKQIELQQLISGNRFSQNDATDDRSPSTGATNGSGNSVTQNPNAGGTILR